MHLATGSYGIGVKVPDPVVMCRMSLARDPEALPLDIQKGTCSKPCSYGSLIWSHDPGSQSRRYLVIHVKDAGSNTLVVMAREGVPALGAGGFPVRSRDHKKRHLEKAHTATLTVWITESRLRSATKCALTVIRRQTPLINKGTYSNS